MSGASTAPHDKRDARDRVHRRQGAEGAARGPDAVAGAALVERPRRRPRLGEPRAGAAEVLDEIVSRWPGRRRSRLMRGFHRARSRADTLCRRAMATTVSPLRTVYVLWTRSPEPERVEDQLLADEDRVAVQPVPPADVAHADVVLLRDAAEGVAGRHRVAQRPASALRGASTRSAKASAAASQASRAEARARRAHCSLRNCMWSA